MDINAAKKKAASIIQSELICRCCGAKVHVISAVTESICNFCEAHVSFQDKDIVHGNSAIEKNLAEMQECAAQARWADGTQYADALAATKDPYFLFGASSFYKSFSDYTYYGVDYTLEGFMYSNAQRRSDELQKNKYNAVALISKSKEYLFRALKVISSNPQPDDPTSFLSFMANMKLKRIVNAQKALAGINSSQGNELMRSYANMAFGTETKSKDAEKFIELSLSYGISNSIYYLAMHVAMKKRLDEAISLLDILIAKTGMPMAISFSYRLKDTKASSYR
ncbi:MAG: hypothetical protein ACYCO0_00020 [Candidatus Micrarchaeaceae archaeon]